MSHFFAQNPFQSYLSNHKIFLTNFVHVLVQKLPFSNGFFSSNVHIRERSFWGATNWRAGTAIVHVGERCSFWGATNRMAVTAIVHFGEHCSFWGATNKSAVTAPQNEHMKKAFRKWQFSHPNREQNWSFQSVAPSRMIYIRLFVVPTPN